MIDPKSISIEFTIREAEILRRALQNHQPSIDDELISIMLFNRITSKIAKAVAEK